jgi:hypothetical protein
LSDFNAAPRKYVNIVTTSINAVAMISKPVAHPIVV